MTSVNLEILNSAAQPGGPSALSEVTHLRPAAGEQALIAPAKYALQNSDSGTYVFETRFINGEPTRTVLVDSRTSIANRMEDAIRQAINNGHPIFSKMPRIRVTYQDKENPIVEWDLTLPHRAFDGHIRFGYVDGKAIDDNPAYWAARNSTQRNAWDLFAISPITVLFGGWDSLRKLHQAKFPAAVVGEIIGVLADQYSEPNSLVTKRSGARIDPIAASVSISSETAGKIAKATEKSLIEKKIKKLNGTKKDVKGSELGLGSIPPGVEALDGIATSSIIRSYVLSFATLRQLHFGKGADGDASIRSLLSAMAIDAMVRADSELYLRANTHLIEAEKPICKVDQRMGDSLQCEPLTIDQADNLLEEAYAQAAEKTGIQWQGQILEVTGEPGIIAKASAEEEDKE